MIHHAAGTAESPWFNDRSAGHIGFYAGEHSGGSWEYFRTTDGTLYRARQYCFIQWDGYRVGAFFVAPPHMAERAIADLPQLFAA